MPCRMRKRPAGRPAPDEQRPSENPSHTRPGRCRIPLHLCREVNPDIRAIKGRVVSGDQFISSSEIKDRLIAEFEADCTEMEGASIAHGATLNGIPFVIIRAISDKADNSAEMDYPTFEAQAAQHCARVTMMVAARLAETNEEKSAAELPAIQK